MSLLREFKISEKLLSDCMKASGLTKKQTISGIKEYLKYLDKVIKKLTIEKSECIIKLPKYKKSKNN